MRVRVSLSSLTLCLTTMSMSGLASTGDAWAGPNCGVERSVWAGSTCDKQLDWEWNPAARSFAMRGQRVPTNPAYAGPRYEWEISSRCGGTSANCGAQALSCPILPDGRRGQMYTATGRLLSTNGQPDPNATPISEEVCDYPAGAAVPIAVIQAAAREQLSKRVKTPTVGMSPPGGTTLVTLPTIFWATRYGQETLSITNPVPGSITATPEYTWDFGDDLSGVGPGRAYEQGIYPSDQPDYYLTATWNRPGIKKPTVTVTWKVRFRLEDAIDVDLAPIVFTSSANVRVATAASRLVNK